MAGNLGRIGGHLLKDNLLRNGSDLAFDTDLLYLKVSPVVEPFIEDGETGDPNYDSTLPAALQGTGVGINVDVPVFDLDVNNDFLTTNYIVDNNATIDNILIQNNSYFTTTVGPINLVPSQSNPYIRHNRLITDDLEFNDNFIQGLNSNQSIELRPNASGTIELVANTNITGDLYVSGNIDISGNLSKQGNLILGDDVIDGETVENDTVDFNVNLQQSLLPGLDNAYDLGRNKNDSSFGRWSEIHSPGWNTIENINPENVRVSDQIIINGVDNEIFALQSNDDVTILPNTGITFIEDLEFEDNTITNTVTRTTTFGSHLFERDGFVDDFDNIVLISDILVITGDLSFVGFPAPNDRVRPFNLQRIDRFNFYDETGNTLLWSFEIAQESDFWQYFTDIITINLERDVDHVFPEDLSGTASQKVAEFNNVIADGASYIIEYEQVDLTVSTEDTAIRFRGTDRGYYQFAGTNAFVIPAGDNSTRPTTAELGDTRWNTQEGYLECFDGNVYIIATGAGEEVTEEIQEDFANVYSLILG